MPTTDCTKDRQATADRQTFV